MIEQNIKELEGVIPQITEPKKQGKRILPILVIKRAYDCLQPTSMEVRMEYSKLKEMGWYDAFLKKTSGYPYYNTSPFTLQTILEEEQFFAERLDFYVRGFSINVNHVINQFDFRETLREEPETFYALLCMLNTDCWDLQAGRIPEEEWQEFLRVLADRYGWKDISLDIQ